MNPVEIIQELVTIPSEFGNEHRIIEYIERKLKKKKIEYTSVPFIKDELILLKGAQRPILEDSNRRNIVGIRRGRGGGRSLILNCHLDIVPAGDPSEWRDPPFSGRLIDGRVYGRGAYDDKAGVAICLNVLHSLATADLSGDLIVHFALEDETTGNGSLLCLRHGPAADAAIIIDGTRGDRGINEHAGNLKFRVTTFGSPASVSVSHMGTNACHMMAEIIVALQDRFTRKNKTNKQPWLQFPSPNQISTISLDSQETCLTVPDRATAMFYATFTPDHNSDQILKMISDVSNAVAKKFDCPRLPEIEIEFLAEPVSTDASEVEAAISSAMGRAVPFGPSTGTSDLRHFVDAGIPCVLFGPGMGQNPHRANEYFEIESLDHMIGVFTEIVRQWCK